MTANMNVRCAVITMVDGRTIRGSINIGASSRLSDFLNRRENTFVTLFDAGVEDSGKKEVFFIDRNHIAYAKQQQIDPGPSRSFSSEPIEIDAVL